MNSTGMTADKNNERKTLSPYSTVKREENFCHFAEKSFKIPTR
jgi:hypothetical protein